MAEKSLQLIELTSKTELANSINTALTYLSDNSQSGDYPFAWLRRNVVETILSLTSKIKPHILEANTNIVLAEQGGEKGLANSPHRQSFTLEPSLKWDKVRPHSNESPSQYDVLETILNETVESLVKKYIGQPAAAVNLTKESGATKAIWGKSEVLTQDRALRLVLKDGSHPDKLYFANLSYEQYRKIRQDVKSPFSHPLTQLLTDGITQSELSYLTSQNIHCYDLNQWYEQGAAILTLSTLDQPLPLHDPRGALRINMAYTYSNHNAAYTPSKIDITAAHLPATAAPITQWFQNQILPLAHRTKDLSDITQPATTDVLISKNSQVHNQSRRKTCPSSQS
jgi:hypothetical protein